MFPGVWMDIAKVSASVVLCVYVCVCGVLIRIPEGSAMPLSSLS